jgi:SAM-dependent methyltransferase
MGSRLNNAQGFRPSKKIGVTITVMKCDHCGLIFSNPMPTVDTLGDHYDVPAKDYWDESYFNKNSGYFKEQIDWYRRLSPNLTCSKALDIGAGIGKCMKALSIAGFEVSGIEPSPSFAKKAIEINRIDPEHLKICSVEEASFPEEYFDFVTFGAVLEHVYDPSSSIQKAMKWLKPSGLIHLEVPSAAWLVGKIVNLTYRLIGQRYVTNISPMHPPYHLYEFTLESFKKNGERFNYEIADHKFYVGDTFLPRPLDWFIRPVMRASDSGMQLTVWLRKSK